MADTTAMPPSSSGLVKLRGRLAALPRNLIQDYAALLVGQVGRLFCSMVYFVLLARALTLEEFGLFATASSIGVVLSRIAGLGFISPLYRVATIRPQLIGAYTAGLLVAVAASLPIVAGIAAILYFALYSGAVSLSTFAIILAAEIIAWRGLEAVIIVQNGIGRFRTGALLSIAGVAIKAVAVLAFVLSGGGDLDRWAPFYLAGISLVLLVGAVRCHPRQKLRWRPKAWVGRIRDALGVSAAEALFYTQSELDKVLVLAIGGEAAAGLYAILMRLVDLTATPMRAANTMIVQAIMRKRKTHANQAPPLWIDPIIALVSVGALIALAVLLWLTPGVLGENITMASAYVLPVLLVPAFRNAIEY
ncbi:lipopolysaccharide biosynthesis protein, partial [Rhizobiaceae bacterium]|nr:lipopolysaccharide biosynthesis protein [Rhizobiaceae bacterium]